MPSPFKYAKEKSVAQLAAELARLRKEEDELEEELKKEPRHSGRLLSAYWRVRSSISSLTGKHRRRHRPKREEEGGRRMQRTTVKKQRRRRR
jgi:hypothetical protein